MMSTGKRRYFTVRNWLITLDNGEEFVVVNSPDREDAYAGALQVIKDHFPGRKFKDMRLQPTSIGTTPVAR